MRTTLNKELILILISLIPGLYLFLNLDIIPGTVAIHFNFQMEPDGYGNRYLPAILPLGVYLLLLFLPLIDPKRNDTISAVFFVIRLITQLLISTVSMLIYVSYTSQVKVETLFPLCVILFLIFLGNYLKKVRPNYFIGIRTPWTLESPRTWRDTHLLSSRLLFFGGLLSLPALLLFPEASSQIMLIYMCISGILPAILSFFIFRKYKKEGEL